MTKQLTIYKKLFEAELRARSRWKYVKYRNPGFFGVKTPDFVHSLGILFIHIPKNAGISLAKAFYGHPVGHRPLFSYLSENAGMVSGLTKVCVVRDPVDRFLSAYYFLREGGLEGHKLDKRLSVFIRQNYPTAEMFLLEWLNKKRLFDINHFMPQSFFINDMEGNVQCDFVFRFESLGNDVIWFSERTGLTLNVRIENKNTKKEGSELSPLALEKLHLLYADDYRNFGHLLNSEG